MMMMAPVAVVADVVCDLAPGILPPLGALGAVLLSNLGPVGAPVLAVTLPVAAITLAIALIVLAIALPVTLVGLPIVLSIELWHDGLVLMVVTLGAAGCVYFTSEHDGVVVGFGVDAIDATGAGDAFVAGLLHGLMADRGVTADASRVRDLCRFANAVAALATTERGAIPAMPTLEQVHQLLSTAPTR
jgi:hypothetical protein